MFSRLEGHQFVPKVGSCWETAERPGGEAPGKIVHVPENWKNFVLLEKDISLSAF